MDTIQYLTQHFTYLMKVKEEDLENQSAIFFCGLSAFARGTSQGIEEIHILVRFEWVAIK